MLWPWSWLVLAVVPVHSDQTDAAEWLAPLLTGLGLSLAAAAGLLGTLALTTTGAVRAVRGTVDWQLWIRGLAVATASALEDADSDFEELEQALLEKVEKALSLCRDKRPHEGGSGEAESSSSATKRPAVLQPPTAESEEALRTARWCRDQPILVSGFVRRVLPPVKGADHPQVECRCGHTCRSNNFRSHVISSSHEREFFALLQQSETLGAQAAVARVTELVAELERRAMGEQLAAHALRAEVGQLQAQLGLMQRELGEERGASYYFENRYTHAQRQLDGLQARGGVSPTAALHQRLWEQGLFDQRRYPLNHTIDELHSLTLTRVELGDDLKRGGADLHLTPSARAFATQMYNKSNASGYRQLRAVYLWLPHPSDVARLPPFEKGGPFVAIGCHQREWGQQAFRFFDAAGYDPRTQPFGISYDPAKMKAKFTWDHLF